MEPDVRVLTPEEATQHLLPLLEQGETVPLTVTGSSMYPFLAHGRDTVYLKKFRTEPRVGDLVFYRRSAGHYILHRIVAAGDTYTLLGDRQSQPEPGIRREQILAQAVAVRRNGKLLEPDHPIWRFFRGPWQWLRPLRPWLIRAYCLVTGQEIEQ